MLSVKYTDEYLRLFSHPQISLIQVSQIFLCQTDSDGYSL